MITHMVAFHLYSFGAWAMLNTFLYRVPWEHFLSVGSVEFFGIDEPVFLYIQGYVLSFQTSYLFSLPNSFQCFIQLLFWTSNASKWELEFTFKNRYIMWLKLYSLYGLWLISFLKLVSIALLYFCGWSKHVFLCQCYFRGSSKIFKFLMNAVFWTCVCEMIIYVWSPRW